MIYFVSTHHDHQQDYGDGDEHGVTGGNGYCSLDDGDGGNESYYPEENQPFYGDGNDESIGDARGGGESYCEFNEL